MADEMTLVPKHQYENMLKQLESFKSRDMSIDKAQKLERSDDDTNSDIRRSSETVTQKTDSEKPHFYVEKTFKQLFTEQPKNATNNLSDQQTIQSSSKQLHSNKLSTKRKIPANSKSKRKTIKLLHGIPDSAIYKLKRQVHKSGRFSNQTSQDFKREKVNTSNMILKRQVQSTKRPLNDAEQDFRREKQKIWINYLV